MAKKTLNSPKNCIFSLKKGFEPQYFTSRTLEKYSNLNIKNVLKISPKLRLSVLINFVLIKKRSIFIHCLKILNNLSVLINFVLIKKMCKRFMLADT